MLPKENSLLKVEKIEQKIRTPFIIYYDIEAYNQHLKKLNNSKKLKIQYMKNY